MWSYKNEDLNNPEIQALTKKIQVNIDSEADSEFPKKNGCNVIIETTIDKYQLRIKDPKGSPLNLCTNEDVKLKFFNNVDPVLTKHKAEELYNYLTEFDKHEDLKKLGALTMSLNSNIL